MRLHLRHANRWAACAFALALAACGGGGSSPPADSPSTVIAAADYYPMGAGDRWLFDDSSVRVCGTRSVAGETATVMRMFDVGGLLLDESLYVKNAGGVRELVADDADAFTRAIGPLQQMRMPLVSGAAFTQIDKTVDSGVDIDGDGRTEAMAIMSVVVVQGVDDVDVPAGNFARCVHLRTLITQTVTLSAMPKQVVISSTGDEWYAPGIGIVKGEYLRVSGDQIETGSRALTGFNVNGRRSDLSIPVLTELWPPDGSTQGSGLAVWVGFSEGMDATSLQEGGLRVTDASGSSVAGSVWVRGASASFVPATPWAPGRYTASVNARATDRVGNPLVQERVWSFTVDPGLNRPAFTTALRPAPAPPTSAR